MTDKEIEVIVKPIFTKMFNSNFSACEYGIECYKKGMEYQGIKELAIENDNLIKRIDKLEMEKCELLGIIQGKDELIKDLTKDKEELTEEAKTIIQDLLDNSDEYARQRAIDFLKEIECQSSTNS